MWPFNPTGGNESYGGAFAGMIEGGGEGFSLPRIVGGLLIFLVVLTLVYMYVFKLYSAERYDGTFDLVLADEDHVAGSLTLTAAAEADEVLGVVPVTVVQVGGLATVNHGSFVVSAAVAADSLLTPSDEPILKYSLHKLAVPAGRISVLSLADGTANDALANGAGAVLPTDVHTVVYGWNFATIQLLDADGAVLATGTKQ